MKKIIVLISLLAFVCAGSIAIAAEAKVCCKDGKVVAAKDAAACTKAGGKVVAKSQCKAAPKKK